MRRQDPSVIIEETDQVDQGCESGSSHCKEPVAIHVDEARETQVPSCSPCLRKPADVEDDLRGFTLTRSHSISSSSDISRLDGTPSKCHEETAKNLTAHSLTDVTTCDNPSCQIKNRSHRHSTPGRLCSYLRLCSVVDLPALGATTHSTFVPSLFILSTGSTRSLFSTAVISGSSSAPDLKDVQLFAGSLALFCVT